MIFLNKQNLPQAIADAVKNDKYSRGDADISVTQLISPPRQIALQHEHKDKLTEDVSDRLWSLIGQSVHTILERANRSGVAEKRFFMTVNGWKLSGAFDAYYADGLLQDYKITSSWAVKDGPKEEWIQQLNIGRVMIEDTDGVQIKKLEAVVILRDWSRLEALRSPGYPQAQVVLLHLPLWSREKTLSFISQKVSEHQKARVELPLCTPIDRWQKSPVFAVMRGENKRATKLFDFRVDAETFALQDKEYKIVDRPGQNIRCLAYCSVANFCQQNLDSLEKAKEK